jgi:hypothetical protein
MQHLIKQYGVVLTIIKGHPQHRSFQDLDSIRQLLVDQFFFSLRKHRLVHVHGRDVADVRC